MEVFARLPDPRARSGMRYPQKQLLSILALGTLRQGALNHHSIDEEPTSKPSPISHQAQRAGLQLAKTLKVLLRAS